jgi:hypothetical protein
MLWQVKGKRLNRVETTYLGDEDLQEADLEDWIQNNPDILGERLLIIGRQVQVADVPDTLDLLALDRNGDIVIIELKRGAADIPVDFQALRYASYVSRWSYDDVEDQAEAYFIQQQGTQEEFNFIEAFEEFFEEEIPDINQDQRLLVVGRSISQRLASVASWLLERGIDVKVVEITPYKVDEDLYLHPRTILPTPGVELVGPRPPQRKPWQVDGQSWHLDKRCGRETRTALLELNKLIQDMFNDIDGPNWGQKFYVSFHLGGYNWIAVRTHQTVLIVDIHVKQGTFEEEAIVEQLPVARFPSEGSFSEKLHLDSSVEIIPQSAARDRIRLRAKEDFDLQDEAFKEFLRHCHDASPW